MSQQCPPEHNDFDEPNAEREWAAYKRAQEALLSKQRQLNEFAKYGRTANARRLRKDIVESTQPGTELEGASDEELAQRHMVTTKRVKQVRDEVDRILGRKRARDSFAW